MVHVIAILCALAIERWSSFGEMLRKSRILHFYVRYTSGLISKLGLKNASVCGAFVLLIAVIIIAVIGMILSALSSGMKLHGLFPWLFTVVIVLYTLGSNFYGTNEEREIDDSVEGSCVRANNCLFAIVFWAALFGPAGAILYRISEYLTEDDYGLGWQAAAEKWLQILDWLPLRFIGLGFAFVGHFNAAISVWLDRVIGGLASSLALVTHCADAVLKATSKTGEVEGAEPKGNGRMLYPLFDRIIILWLVVIAVIALI